MSDTSNGVRPSRLILLILIAAGGASIPSTDLCAPSLPHLPAYFGTDAERVQLTMALNMASFAIAQLFWGPLSDRFGRRAVFITGMASFALTVLGAALAQSIDQLLAGRILMGAAASVEAVVVLAVIGNLYRSEESAKVFALYGMTIALVPAIGPVIGGYIFEWFGWRAKFYLLTGVVLLVLAFCVAGCAALLLVSGLAALRPNWATEMDNPS